jgi:GH25 family lysozyme M1 (1,4-beta-N-acetylmuramidase)
VYFFTQAVNEVEAVEEASMALSLVGGYQLSYPIFLDIEGSGGRGDALSSSERTAVAKAFCRTVSNSGYSAGVYANKNWLNSMMSASSLTGYNIWLAQYAAAPTYSTTRYDLWQYSSKGSIAGISGNVDMNLSYLGY